MLQLSINQERAVELLMSGLNDREVAKVVGVHRVTLTRWRLYHPGFQAALNARRMAMWSTAQDSLRTLLPKAVKAIAEDLNSPGPGRSKLAMELLKFVGMGTQSLGVVGPIDPTVIVEMAADGISERQRRYNPIRSTDEDREILRDELLRLATEPPRPGADPDIPTDQLEPSHLTDG